MARDGVNDPLMESGSRDVRPKTNQVCDPERRRLRRCKSSPSISCEVNGIEPCVRPFMYSFGQYRLRKVVIILFIYLVTGTICSYIVRNQINGKKTNEIVDSVYFCIVTMTGVGYGDLVPNSVVTKILVCVFVFSGLALVGLILTKGANCLVEKQEIMLFEALYMSQRVGTVETLEHIETNRAKSKCVTVFIVLLVLVVIGTGFLATAEKLDIVDAFYCVCTTITTLGYGDKSFSTTTGRVFAIFWILTSAICLALFFFAVVELNTKYRQKELVKWVLTKRNEDLEVAHLDDDLTVSQLVAEFVR